MRLFQYAAVRVPTAFALGVFVFVAAGIIAQSIGAAIPETFSSKSWLTTLLFQLFMGALSVLLMLLIGRGGLARFGFTLGSRAPYLRIVGMVVAVQAVCLAVFSICPGSGPGHFAEQFSFLQLVIGVWVVASVCEEVVARGLVQGFLARHAGSRLDSSVLPLSLPVIVGAVYFSAMHLPLLAMGMDRCLAGQILLSTFLVGLIAGYFRETTGSLIPAMVVHSLANVVGWGLGSLLELLGVA